LDKGDIEGAQTLLNTVEPYRKAIASFPRAETGIAGSKKAIAAQREWTERHSEKALQLLSEAELGFSSSFVKDISVRVHREISEDRIRAALAKSIDTPLQRIERLKVLQTAVAVDPGNEQASLALAKDASDLAKILLANADHSDQLSASAARVSVERFHIAEEWIKGDPAFSKTEELLRSLAYPANKVQIAIDDPDGCLPIVSKRSLRSVLQKSLAPTVEVNDLGPNLSIRLKAFSCASVDVPHNSIERINSTYVAATSRMPNPEYLRLETLLASAEAELNRAAVAYAGGANFSTGLALGLARGNVNRIQQALAQTTPSISEDINQQYQYEKFEAYRSYGIRSTIQMTSGSQPIAETKVIVSDEQRSSGISGVLPQDKSGIRNAEPSFLSMEESAHKTADEFSKKLGIAVRELIAEHFAIIALDHAQDSDQRLAAVLDFHDLSRGTKYQFDPSSASFQAAILNGGSSMKDYLDSLTLPVKERQPAAAVQAFQEAKHLDLERAISSVVGVETDTNTSGSGFFVASNCLVVTNAHVIEAAETVIVRDSSKKIFVAQLLARDSDRDLALLSTTARTCSVLPLGDSSNVAIGQEVYAIGNPLGLTGTVTKGIISAIRSVSGMTYIQIDATINPGNSGGPLLATDGDVFGVTTFKVKGFEGLNFAVASNEIRAAFSQFLH
jgi:S1-C subfamily serine protease